MNDRPDFALASEADKQQFHVDEVALTPRACPIREVARGLCNPRGIEQLPDGSLLVAEAGTGTRSDGRVVRLEPTSEGYRPAEVVIDGPRDRSPATSGPVEKAYERWLDGAFLRQGQARGSFEYAGILFEEYRGKVGSVDFTDASKAYFFPVGVPGLFRQYNAPADFVETANTIGLPRYAKQAVDQQFARWVMLHVQSNPLPICTRPRVLLKGKRT